MAAWTSLAAEYAVGCPADHQRRGCQGTGAHAVPAGADRGRVVWAVDGEEHVDTEALGWTGQAVYVRVADPRCQSNAIWLDGARRSASVMTR